MHWRSLNLDNEKDTFATLYYRLLHFVRDDSELRFWEMVVVVFWGVYPQNTTTTILSPESIVIPIRRMPEKESVQSLVDITNRKDYKYEK